MRHLDQNVCKSCTLNAQSPRSHEHNRRAVSELAGFHSAADEQVSGAKQRCRVKPQEGDKAQERSGHVHSFGDVGRPKEISADGRVSAFSTLRIWSRAFLFDLVAT
jgi:hypothetical protein